MNIELGLTMGLLFILPFVAVLVWLAVRSSPR